MKLIDILVQELPKRGGWPEDVEEVWQDYDRLMRPLGWFHDELCDDHRRQHHDADVKINRKQYESALAASKPEWNGEGLPPVGLPVELQYWSDGKVEIVRVIAYHGNEAWVEFTDDCRNMLIGNPQFRPIRSEADKKRDEVGLALYHAINWNAEGELVSPSRMEDYKKAYDAIAAGKIPHIRID